MREDWFWYNSSGLNTTEFPEKSLFDWFLHYRKYTEWKYWLDFATDDQSGFARDFSTFVWCLADA